MSSSLMVRALPEPQGSIVLKVVIWRGCLSACFPVFFSHKAGQGLDMHSWVKGVGSSNVRILGPRQLKYHAAALLH